MAEQSARPTHFGGDPALALECIAARTLDSAPPFPSVEARSPLIQNDPIGFPEMLYPVAHKDFRYDPRSQVCRNLTRDESSDRINN